MSTILAQLSQDIASAVDRAAPSIVQVHGHHRPAAAVVVAKTLLIAPARAVGDDAVSVRLADGAVVEGAVLGHDAGAGLAVVRVPDLAAPPLAQAGEPRVGHLAVAIGRTWSGGVMATLTDVVVVGGPLRTGRTTEIDRVIRIGHPPHGALTGGALVDDQGRALGFVTGSAIRGTTLVIPAAHAWPLASRIADQGGARQGFVGISSTTVALPERQRAGRTQEYGLLVNAVVHGGPADAAGLLVGDVLVAFDGQPLQEPETLVTLLRGDRIGKPAAFTILRGGEVREVPVTIGERPKRDRQGWRSRR